MEKLPLSSFLQIFDELYTGQHGDATWVIDRGGRGFIDAIRALTAEEASTAMHKDGSTIAAHTEHLRWSLNFAHTYMKGGQPDTDWSKSWAVHTVTEKEWKALQDALEKEYNAIRDTIEKITDWSAPMLLNGTLALLPHAAYHLGAIKQKMLYLRHQ